MFTGIVQAAGKADSISFSGGAAKLVIEAAGEAAGFWDDCTIGDSIAIDGVCLTIKEMTDKKAAFDVSAETLQRSTIGKYKTGATGSKVNLEKALRLSDRLGGHFMQGHVDGLGKYIGSETKGENVEMKFSIPKELERYVVEKGSIAINGVSLTAYGIKDGAMTIAVVPHTLEVTNLSGLKPGSPVNLECDIIAKYTEKLLLSSKDEGISVEFLNEKGFI
ncbi:MAG: riboflavin synthase [Nitrospinota bacterium]